MKTPTKIARALAGAGALVTTSLGLSVPAHAEQVLQGQYSYTQEGLGPVTWSILPSCVPTVGDLRENLELPVACRLHVAAVPSTAVSGGDARLTGGLWAFSTNKADGMTCPDGSTAPIMDSYEFDDVTLTGTRSISHNAVCGLQPAIQKFPFTLAYQGELTMPVQQYPLYCEPGGLRRCF